MRSGGVEARREEGAGRRTGALAQIVATGLVWAASSLAAQTGGEAITVEGGGAPLRLVALRHHGYQVVDLAGLIGGVLTNVTLTSRTASGRLGGETLQLQVGSPFFRYGSRTFQLSNPPYRVDDTVWVPAELFTRWWPAHRGAGNAAVAEEESGEEGWADPVREAGPWRVVIDPGHGGRDPGTQTRHGRTREKDIVLRIAGMLRDKLARMPDVKPILTRDRDRFVTVRGRPSYALSHKGDLFLSIHVNSAPSRQARGFETYYLGEARSDKSREVAIRENSALKYEAEGAPESDLSFILASLDLRAYKGESNRLGGYIQNALRRTHPGPDRGVKPGPYWVLVGASGHMPTVLVEVGFLSNPSEERFLASMAGEEKIASALARAIRAYLDQYGRQLQTAGG